MNTIDYEDFSKIDLRVATILEAERLEDSEKLVRLQVDLGEEKRQILAGIAPFYPPDELVGKQVVVVANLASRKMMGEESQGMLLAADSEKPVLLTVAEMVNPGSSIR